MEILRKRLRPAEIRRRCVCIPKEKQHLFPKVGEKLLVTDSKTGSVHEVVVRSQYRLGMPTWYGACKQVQPGDVIVFRKENGGMSVYMSAMKTPVGKWYEITKDTFDWMVDALSAVEAGEIPARIRIGKSGFSVEWGDHIKETQIESGEGEG